MNDNVALALLCLVVMIYQLGLTRLLSVVLRYHYTFLTLALVMLGLGVPALWLSLSRSPQRYMPQLLFYAALTLTASVIVILKWAPIYTETFWFILIVIAAAQLPLLFLGACICLYLMRAEGKAFSRAYAADLIGAAIGAALIVPLLTWIPAPHLIGVLSLVVLFVLLTSQDRLRHEALLLGLAVILCLIWGRPFTVWYSKYNERAHRVAHERWTPMARLSVLKGIFWVSDPEAGFIWGAGTHAPRVLREQMWMEQDADAGTPITRFDGSFEGLDYLLYDVTSAAYQLRPLRSAAIIGGGGGRDILVALKADVSSIHAVEINPATVKLVSETLGAFSGDIYHRPGVTTTIAEGRSFLARTQERFDLIQLSLIDSWAASLSGAFTLMENNLYTRQAYQRYFEKLTPQGMVTTSRWNALLGDFEVQRLALLNYQALKDIGVEDPQHHIIVLHGGHVSSVIASRSPWSAQDMQALQHVAQERGFTIAYPVPDGELAQLLSPNAPALVALRRSEGIDISPPDDDRPFFFNVRLPWQVHGEATYSNDKAIRTLQSAVAIVSVIALAMFFLPFAINQRARRYPAAQLAASSAYFILIGAGFMLMEIFFLQRMILLLGNPAFSASVVLSGLLAGLAAGAWMSGRQGGIFRLMMLMPILLLLLVPSLPALMEQALQLSLSARVMLALAVLMPCGWLAGFFFPAGVQSYGLQGMPWFWAVNGAAGVLASAWSLLLAMTFGYRVIGYGAMLAYLAAGLMIMLSKRLSLCGREHA